MCVIVVHYTLCKHRTKSKIPCDPSMARRVGYCLHNSYNEMHHGTCPKCSHYTTAPALPEICHLSQMPSAGLPLKRETSDIKDAPSAQGKKRMGSFKRLVLSVSKSTLNLNRKSSEDKLKHSVSRRNLSGTSSDGKPVVRPPMSYLQTIEIASPGVQMTSEQLADEYKSLLDIHPALQETDSRLPHNLSIPTLDIETATTWSGLITRAMGGEGWEVWRGGR
jgi:hypothetical protein